ncbi:MAG: prepilin-type N-terminal cleavage/methylation domain-containing protein [Planctomycetales bacterium]|nr:prepilin-type N-terminal cleavage/methylation domain-containing protein [Planctomycetales bacterium]
MSHRPTGHAMRPRCARGFTLVELLIAMTLTLMLVYAIAQFYAFVGETVRDGRAQIEMGGQLRAASQRLQQDFAELTVRVGGRIDAGQGMGCLEIWEGIWSDADPVASLAVSAATGVPNGIVDVNSDAKPDGAMLGDLDDILVMTIRSQGEPFVGRWWNPVQGIYQIMQSNLAEVTWFTTFKDTNGNGSWDWDSNGNGVIDPTDAPEPRYLVRRQLLVRPDLAVSWPGAPNALPAGQSIFHHNDVSCHLTPNGFVANSLSDLSQRENRFAHINLFNLNQNGLYAAQGNMPNAMQINVALTGNVQGSSSFYSLDGIQQFIGEDRMLSNVLGFDIRVYDPYAVLRADNTDYDGQQTNGTTNDDALGVLAPGDPGYAWATANTAQMGSGAYVDLWYNRAYQNIPAARQNSAYSWAPNANSFSNGASWDTWTTAYEKDGIDQYSDSLIDRMVNGLDDDNQNGVDDPGEAETRPPYPVWIGDNGVDDDLQNGVDDPGEKSYVNADGSRRPSASILRGIEVRIRMYEPGTRQTRQATVATDFIPE